MQSITQGKIVYVDVDDTLIRWEKPFHGSTEKDYVGIDRLLFYPNRKLIERLQRLKVRGFFIVVWSQAGGDWAEKVVQALSIEDRVDLCISKPLFVIDDLPPQQWMTVKAPEERENSG